MPIREVVVFRKFFAYLVITQFVSSISPYTVKMLLVYSFEEEIKQISPRSTKT